MTSAAANRRLAARRRGSTLLIVLLSTTSLSVIIGLSLLNITSRGHTAARSSAFNEAGRAADAAAELAVAEIRRVMPDFVPERNDAWRGFSLQVNAGAKVPAVNKTLDAAVKLQLIPPTFRPNGDAAGWQTSKAVIDAPEKLRDSSDRQWLRVRAVGTTAIPGWRGPSKNKLDNQLRGIAFAHDWHTRQSVAEPQVSRWIEVIVQPVTPYNGALSCPGAIKITNSHAVIDSFDSGSSTKSSGGVYDSAKRQRNGSVITNLAELSLDGTIYGNVGSNGGSVPSDATIHGTFQNGSARHYPPVQPPNWSTATSLLTTVTSLVNANFKIDATLNAALEKYTLPALTGELKIDGVAGSTVEVWIEGNVTGKIRVKPGVKAIVYFGGDLKVDASELDNDTLRAGNLQLIGIQPPAGATKVIEIDLDSDLYASIYAPGHDMKLTGHGHLSGSVVAKSFTAHGKVQIHYDEALARLPKPIADYRVVSWVEEVR